MDGNIRCGPQNSACTLCQDIRRRMARSKRDGREGRGGEDEGNYVFIVAQFLPVAGVSCRQFVVW